MSEPNLTDVAAQLGVTPSPQLQLIAQLLQQQRSRTTDDDERGYEERAERERTTRRQRKAFEHLREMNRQLAAACGACVCWGRFASCPRCGGLGAAGTADVDPAMFRKHIEPALLRMGLLRSDDRAQQREPKQD